MKFTYIELLKDYKLYRVTAPKPSQKVIQIEQDSSVQHMVNKAEKKCKEGKEPHPISNRCVKKCNKGETRDSSGKCTSKNKPKSQTRKTVKKANPKHSAKQLTKESLPKNLYRIKAYVDANDYEIKPKNA